MRKNCCAWAGPTAPATASATVRVLIQFFKDMRASPGTALSVEYAFCESTNFVMRGSAACLGFAWGYTTFSRVPPGVWRLACSNDTEARIRSEARRVGKEGVSLCSFRWSPYH